eukprot:g28994.t1
MSFTISVCLLSGHLADLEVSPAQSVLELMIQASKTLGRPLKSLAYQGRRLLRGESVKELGLEDGSVIPTFQRNLNAQQLYASSSAFAAITDQGEVVAWGDPAGGGDCQDVADQLRFVQNVVTWGDEHCGGDARAVQEKLHNVSEIFASNKAFAALKKDGTVVTWGKALSGGDSSAVQAHLFDVERIYCGQAMAALRRDGSVITWGHSTFGGDSRSVQAGTFAALRDDGTVITWGDANYGGDSSSVQPLALVSLFLGRLFGQALGLEFPAALQRHMAAVQKRPLKALFLARLAPISTGDVPLLPYTLAVLAANLIVTTGVCILGAGADNLVDALDQGWVSQLRRGQLRRQAAAALRLRHCDQARQDCLLQRFCVDAWRRLCRTDKNAERAGTKEMSRALTEGENHSAELLQLCMRLSPLGTAATCGDSGQISTCS